MQTVELSQPASSSAVSWSVEITSRILCMVLYAYVCYAAFVVFRASQDVRFLLILIAESLTAFFIIIARFPTTINRSAYISFVTVFASFYFTIINLSPGPRLVSAAFTTPLQISGILLQGSAKIYLGRSFGLRPANRGIVARGPYALLRHPIYAGYSLTNLGLLLSCWSVYNLGVFAFWAALQVVRVLEEEKLLREDAAYEQYAKDVRHRIVPFLL